MNNLNETANKILDVAERYTQTQGFNAFSYKDLQREIGIKTSSIHYYFPTKQDLALALTERYIKQFESLLSSIEKSKSSSEHALLALADIYVQGAALDKFCLCGMLASDILSFPETVHTKIRSFFTLLETWIESQIIKGQKSGEIKSSEAKIMAASFLAALEGGMLIARAKAQPEYLHRIVQANLKFLLNNS